MPWLSRVMACLCCAAVAMLAVQALADDMSPARSVGGAVTSAGDAILIARKACHLTELNSLQWQAALDDNVWHVRANRNDVPGARALTVDIDRETGTPSGCTVWALPMSEPHWSNSN
jgi:hypothetical protein